ncbi:MAG: NAD(P)H-dependent oxidoreductase [Chthoniobacterales bacterium]|nr:NAD(P)H-dependent oxidoreductase [Chthoniobacterales bacterium]
MNKLLHIQASPRLGRSASIAVAEHFLGVYRARHPRDTVETLNLWEANLPEIDGETIDAMYAVRNRQPHTPAQLKAWQAVERIIGDFKSADTYLFSLPMWNFGIPYKLKHFIDLLVHRGLTFSFTPEEGYQGLITGKPAVAIYARGGAYGPGSGAEGYDAQSTYLRQILGFIGITHIKEIFVEPTVGSPTAKDEAAAAGNQEAAELAAAT